MMPKPAPSPNADSRPFWDACNREELIYQHCPACGTAQFYPRSVCVGCHNTDLEWRTSAGRGIVYSFTINHRAPNPGFEGDVPYVIALVDLDEGFRMMMNVPDCDPESVHIGMRVAVAFEPRGKEGEQKIPQAVPEA